MNGYQWGITGAAIGAAIGWYITMLFRQWITAKVVRQIIAIEGPCPEGELSFLRDQIEFADRLKDRGVGQSEMLYWENKVKALYESGRLGWTEWDRRGAVQSIQTNLGVTREQLAIN